MQVNHPIKVLILVSNLGRGGAEKQLFMLLEHLDPAVIQVKLISMSRVAGEYWEAPLKRSGIDYVLLPPKHNQWMRFTTVHRVMSEFHPHLIIGWHFFTTLFALPLRRKTKLLVFLQSDADYLLERHFWAPWLIRYVDAAMANTTAVIDQFKARGIEPRRDFQLPNCVKLAPAVNLANEVETIGFCGNFLPVKGLDNWIKAARIVIERGCRARFILAGGGGSSQYQALVETLGIASHFEFPGPVECASYMSRYDLFVLSSCHEGCPNVLLEAMALGIPCIATDVGGVSEVISHGENGYLVPANDEKALADAISELCSNRDKRVAIAKAGWASVQQNRDPNRIARIDLPLILNEVLANPLDSTS